MGQYEGECSGTKRNGRGVLTYLVDGKSVRYDGTWSNDQATGSGTITFADGSTYRGDVVNLKRQGNGSYRSTSGDVFSGTWNEDKITTGSVRYAGGDSYNGSFNNGRPTGETRANQSTSAERQPIVSMLEKVVYDDSTNWSWNRYNRGSVYFDKVRERYSSGKIRIARVGYAYNGGASGWVDATFTEGGGLSCIQFHDSDTCRSPRSFKVNESRSTQSGTSDRSNCDLREKIYCDGDYLYRADVTM